MTFQQLQYLLEVNRTGSFTAAAKNLYVTQSSVSNAITTLENEIGTPILFAVKRVYILHTGAKRSLRMPTESATATGL